MLGTNPTNDDATTQITASLKSISMVVSFPAKNNAKPTASALVTNNNTMSISFFIKVGQAKLYID